MKYLPLVILITFIGFFGISIYKIKAKQDSGNQVNMTKTTLPNFNLPDLFVENKFLDNATLPKKYFLINFFASWCTTCRAEHEVLMRLYDDKIINIYGVTFRDIDNNSKKFLTDYGNPYIQTAKDSQGIFARSLNINAIPETLLVDQNGNITKRYQGNLQEFMIDEIKNLIKSY